jgi:hypothetical protein
LTVRNNPRGDDNAFQWMVTFFLQTIIVVLCGILIGALLRGTGVR